MKATFDHHSCLTDPLHAAIHETHSDSWCLPAVKQSAEALCEDHASAELRVQNFLTSSHTMFEMLELLANAHSISSSRANVVEQASQSDRSGLGSVAEAGAIAGRLWIDPLHWDGPWLPSNLKESRSTNRSL